MNITIPMLIWCPMCNRRHYDDGEFATKHHHTHACQFCGNCWRPALVNTCGVRFLPGFKNDGVANTTEVSNDGVRGKFYDPNARENKR